MLDICKKLFTLLVILVICFKSSLQDYVRPANWIDPHEMDFGHHFQKANNKQDLNDQRMPEDSKKTDPTLKYLKRFVSLMLNSASKNDVNSDRLVGKYEIGTDGENYKYLVQFLKQESVDANELRKLDIILSNMFTSTLMDQVFDSLLSFQEIFLNFILSFNTLLILATSFGVYIFNNLLNAKYTFWYACRYLFIIIMIYDYGLRYKVLLEETEKHNLQVNYSKKCDISLMTWTQWFNYLRDTSACQEKEFVHPLDVVLQQVRHLIIIPLSAIGTGMGSFGKEIWNELGFPWNMVIFPILLLFLALIMAIVLTAANKTSFKIKLFHLLHFEFGEQQQSRQAKPMEVNINLAVKDKAGGDHQQTPQIEGTKFDSHSPEPLLIEEGKKLPKSCAKYDTVSNRDSDGNTKSTQSDGTTQLVDLLGDEISVGQPTCNNSSKTKDECVSKPILPTVNGIKGGENCSDKATSSTSSLNTGEYDLINFDDSINDKII